jgi:predicted AAA+ superfamily ATPase
MKIIHRTLQDNLAEWLFRGKVLILYGARQVGKTTLVKELIRTRKKTSIYLNCDILSLRQSLEIADPVALKSLIGNSEIAVFDEAQQIHNIGLTLKIIHDSYPEIQIIATGSSSFDLSNKINEPLTGRALEFVLYPFSLHELRQIYPDYQLQNNLGPFLRFGTYPEMIDKSESEARLLLDNLTGKYLYKDVFEFETIKRPQLIVKLLQMLALQIGSEVSLNELSVKLRVSRPTVEHYLDILEKAFVIYRLYSFSRNLRSELTRKFKVYFYDVGIRNSLISNYNSLELRNDSGALWENFFISERIKYMQKEKRTANRYFWRTHSKQEIDYIEESDGILQAFECKLNPKSTVKVPAEFKSSYPNSEYQVVHPGNFWKYMVS